MSTIIYGGTIVNEGRTFQGSLTIDNDRITGIYEDSKAPRGLYTKEIDATGCFVIPGVIDEHVHMREPGLTQKADIESETRAAAWGGVTTVFDMPNTKPQTTTAEALDHKFALAAKESHVNYSFFPGATTDNTDFIRNLDIHRIPGVKLFMGASTGNMLVDSDSALDEIFAICAERQLPIMTHCEDTAIINANMAKAKAQYGDDPDITLHPSIRSSEACLKSTQKAIELAHRHHTRLHVAHITTADELQLLGNNSYITAEAVIAHLMFCDNDYRTLGTLIKCNPAVKTAHDRHQLRQALTDGRIYTIGTDHAPHCLSDKQGGCAKAASGMPMIQFSLPSMLSLVDQGVLSIEQMVTLMCHHPALLFGIRQRGFLRTGYKADITIVEPNCNWTVTPDIIQSKCKWSPLTDHNFNWRVRTTICNGSTIYDRGNFDEHSQGEEIQFR